MKVMGIDPGLKGGWVVLTDGVVTSAGSMPLVRTDAQQLDCVALAQLMRGVDIVVLERQFGAREVGADTRLINYGRLLGVAEVSLGAGRDGLVEIDAAFWRVSLGLPVRLPSEWSKVQGKKATLDALVQLWEQHAAAGRVAEGLKSPPKRKRALHDGILAAHAIGRRVVSG
jgi:hypothetical protein